MLRSLFFALGLGLPLHGGITVFLPDIARFWKEALLTWLFIALLTNKNLKTQIQNFKFGFWILKLPAFYALLFLGWLGLLVLFQDDLITGIVAARYISIGFLTFLIIWGITQVFSAKDGQNFFHKFSTGFVIGAVISTLFGIWAQFLNGFETLTNWYSQTISSWVPGQTIPLYHQTSEGLIRMQGLSSGPIEFSHLLVMGLWLSLESQKRVFSMKYLVSRDFLITCLFLFGICASHSRSAMLGALIIVGWELIKIIKSKFKILNLKLGFSVLDTHLGVNLVLILVLAITSLTALKYVVTELPATSLEKVVRLSDSGHITRPIEAFKIGMTSPVTGNLGELGPAARSYNLQHKNTDQAPIAENVFIDYFAQTGLLGLVLVFLFWVTYIYNLNKKVVLIPIVFIILMNLATVLDMAPIAISWFALLSFINKKET